VVVYFSLFEFGLTAANDQYSDEHEMSPEIPLGPSFAWAADEEHAEFSNQEI
jgi:hypothetical protein